MQVKLYQVSAWCHGNLTPPLLINQHQGTGADKHVRRADRRKHKGGLVSNYVYN